MLGERRTCDKRGKEGKKGKRNVNFGSGVDRLDLSPRPIVVKVGQKGLLSKQMEVC